MRLPQAILDRVPPTSPASPVLWYAVLGAPAAWTLQMGVGYWLSEAKCSPAGGPWGISLATWGIAVSGVAFAVGVGAAATAVSIYRTYDDFHAAPPEGRIAFLAVVGMTVSTLFLILIAMSAAGILTFSECSQS
jgi:hypothetical protein